jgi:zinc transport system permease protein
MTEFWQTLDMRYLLPALLGGTGVALIAGPLGSVMVWRRLAYFGDTLSHSGLLGVTLALILHLNVTLGVCIIALMVALGLTFLQAKLKVAGDTLLGLLSHTTLAVGLLALASRQDIQVDVLGFLYGDILTIQWRDVGIIYLGGALVLAALSQLWQSLLRVTVDPELAQVEGVRVQQVQIAYMVLLAFVVAIAIKIVGVLLITALLIIPAASARSIAKSPEHMAITASVMGIIAIVLGLFCSHIWDLPTGPAIVVASSLLFVITSFFHKS